MSVKRVSRGILWTVFVLYGCVVFGILFMGGRHGGLYDDSLWDDIRYSVNLIPFQTIGGYMADIWEKPWMRTLAIRNIFGNLILFYPMGVLLPCLFRGVRTFGKSLLIAICTVFSVEAVQLLLRLGIFDIDDFILNITGWIFGYFTFLIPMVRKILIHTNYLTDGSEKRDDEWQSD